MNTDLIATQKSILVFASLHYKVEIPLISRAIMKELPIVMNHFMQHDGHVLKIQNKSLLKKSLGKDISSQIEQNLISKKFYTLLKFMKSLSIDEKFLIMVTDGSEGFENYVYDSLLEENFNTERKLEQQSLREKHKSLHDKYALFGATQLPVETKIGEASRSARKCVFCGKTMAQGTTFRKNAHAISESLGNDRIFLLEECDKCNQAFGNAIETDAAEFFTTERLLSLIQGKNGFPTFQLNSGGTIKIDSDGITITDNEPVRKAFVEEGLREVDISVLVRFRLHAVYKALVKYAISVLPCQIHECLDDTKAWLLDPDRCPKLPKAIICMCETRLMGYSLATYIRKDGDNTKPYAFGVFRIGQMIIVYNLPFANKNLCSLDDELLAESLLRIFPFDTISGNLELVDFSSNDYLARNQKLKIGIPDGIDLVISDGQ